VPACQSWVLPFWHDADYDEFTDMMYALRRSGPERADEAIRAFTHKLRGSDAVGVQFSVGTDLPRQVTLTVAPDTQQQAAAILREITGYMAPRHGIMQWDQLKTHLTAIEAAVTTADPTVYPSFGLSAIVSRDGGHTQAATSWIGED
jgi:hypothetical protein